MHGQIHAPDVAELGVVGHDLDPVSVNSPAGSLPVLVGELGLAQDVSGAHQNSPGCLGAFRASHLAWLRILRLML
jgi:hypothetical protein